MDNEEFNQNKKRTVENQNDDYKNSKTNSYQTNDHKSQKKRKLSPKSNTNFNREKKKNIEEDRKDHVDNPISPENIDTFVKKALLEQNNSFMELANNPIFELNQVDHEILYSILSQDYIDAFSSQWQKYLLCDSNFPKQFELVINSKYANNDSSLSNTQKSNSNNNIKENYSRNNFASPKQNNKIKETFFDLIFACFCNSFPENIELIIQPILIMLSTSQISFNKNLPPFSSLYLYSKNESSNVFSFKLGEYLFNYLSSSPSSQTHLLPWLQYLLLSFDKQNRIFFFKNLLSTKEASQIESIFNSNYFSNHSDISLKEKRKRNLLLSDLASAILSFQLNLYSLQDSPSTNDDSLPLFFQKFSSFLFSFFTNKENKREIDDLVSSFIFPTFPQLYSIVQSQLSTLHSTNERQINENITNNNTNENIQIKMEVGGEIHSSSTRMRKEDQSIIGENEERQFQNKIKLFYHLFLFFSKQSKSSPSAKDWISPFLLPFMKEMEKVYLLFPLLLPHFPLLKDDSSTLSSLSISSHLFLFFLLPSSPLSSFFTSSSSFSPSDRRSGSNKFKKSPLTKSLKLLSSLHSPTAISNLFFHLLHLSLFSSSSTLSATSLPLFASLLKEGDKEGTREEERKKEKKRGMEMMKRMIESHLYLQNDPLLLHLLSSSFVSFLHHFLLFSSSPPLFLLKGEEEKNKKKEEYRLFGETSFLKLFSFLSNSLHLSNSIHLSNSLPLSPSPSPSSTSSTSSSSYFLSLFFSFLYSSNNRGGNTGDIGNMGNMMENLVDKEIIKRVYKKVFGVFSSSFSLPSPPTPPSSSLSLFSSKNISSTPYNNYDNKYDKNKYEDNNKYDHNNNSRNSYSSSESQSGINYSFNKKYDNHNHNNTNNYNNNYNKNYSRNDTKYNKNNNNSSNNGNYNNNNNRDKYKGGEKYSYKNNNYWNEKDYSNSSNHDHNKYKVGEKKEKRENNILLSVLSSPCSFLSFTTLPKGTTETTTATLSKQNYFGEIISVLFPFSFSQHNIDNKSDTKYNNNINENNENNEKKGEGERKERERIEGYMEEIKKEVNSNQLHLLLSFLSSLFLSFRTSSPSLDFNYIFNNKKEEDMKDKRDMRDKRNMKEENRKMEIMKIITNFPPLLLFPLLLQSSSTTSTSLTTTTTSSSPSSLLKSFFGCLFHFVSPQNDHSPNSGQGKMRERVYEMMGEYSEKFPFSFLPLLSSFYFSSLFSPHQQQHQHQHQHQHHLSSSPFLPLPFTNNHSNGFGTDNNADLHVGEMIRIFTKTKREIGEFIVSFLSPLLLHLFSFSPSFTHFSVGYGNANSDNKEGDNSNKANRHLNLLDGNRSKMDNIFNEDSETENALENKRNENLFSFFLSVPPFNSKINNIEFDENKSKDTSNLPYKFAETRTVLDSNLTFFLVNLISNTNVNDQWGEEEKGKLVHFLVRFFGSLFLQNLDISSKKNVFEIFSHSILSPSFSKHLSFFSDLIEKHLNFFEKILEPSFLITSTSLKKSSLIVTSFYFNMLNEKKFDTLNLSPLQSSILKKYRLLSGKSFSLCSI